MKVMCSLCVYKKKTGFRDTLFDPVTYFCNRSKPIETISLMVTNDYVSDISTHMGKQFKRSSHMKRFLQQCVLLCNLYDEASFCPGALFKHLSQRNISKCFIL